MARNDNEFLGGGVAFNKVGNHPTGDEVAKIDEPRLKPHHITRGVLIVTVAILAFVLYLVGEKGLIPGIQHAQMHIHQTQGGGLDSAPAIDPDKPGGP